MKNKDIRDYANKHKVALWKIADKLNIFDSTFSKKLRKELSIEYKEKIYIIIDELSKDN